MGGGTQNARVRLGGGRWRCDGGGLLAAGNLEETSGKEWGWYGWAKIKKE